MLDAEDLFLNEWGQGDYSLNVGGFAYATVARGDSEYDIEEEIEDIKGLVLISQSCDIAQFHSGRHFVTACPLVEVDERLIKECKSGMRPYFAVVESYNGKAIADLRRVMSVHKTLVKRWKRYSVFSNEKGRVNFAATLERKFGQFAFPDQFNLAIGSFRDKIRKRHDKASTIGAIYRSLLEIRFRAIPDWEAQRRKISVIAIRDPEKSESISLNQIEDELNNSLSKIIWPEGYKWDSPHVLLGFPNDLTADLIYSSRRGDFDYLSI